MRCSCSLKHSSRGLTNIEESSSGVVGKKRYHLVKWSQACRSKRKGGLGVKDLRKQNISLLTKWWWKLDNDEGLNAGGKFNDSHVWKSLMKVKDLYMAGRKIVVRSGTVARLWQDPLGDELPFCDKYPLLFSICDFPNDIVAQCEVKIPVIYSDGD